jgi:two-component system sensor histidine kinase/response regulator
LQRLLKQHMSGPAAGLLFSETMTMTEPLPPISRQPNFDYDAALAASDQEVVEIIADVFMDQWPIDLDKLTQSLAAGDLKPVMHVAHALKGILAIFGASPAVVIASQVEIQSGRGKPEGLADLVAEMVTEVEQLISAIRRAAP